MTQYLKALTPLVAGFVLAALDKLVLGDDVPDATWLALIGIALPVWGLPNKQPGEVQSSVKTPTTGGTL